MNKNHIFWVDLLGIRGLIFVDFVFLFKIDYTFQEEYNVCKLDMYLWQFRVILFMAVYYLGGGGVSK